MEEYFYLMPRTRKSLLLLFYRNMYTCIYFLINYIHCDSIIRQSSGTTGEKRIKRTALYTKSKIFNASSFTGFHIRKFAPPTVIWYGTSVSVFSFMVITYTFS